MSIPSRFQGMRVSVDRGDRFVNKLSSGDDNANQFTSLSEEEDRRMTGDTGYSTCPVPPLVSQRDSPDKLVFWGSEHREFEILEHQGIRTFSENQDQEEDNEDPDDEGSFRDGRDDGPMSISSSSTASSASIGHRRNDNDSNKVERRKQKYEDVPKRIACHSTEELDTCVSGSAEVNVTRSGSERHRRGLKESKSETNVYVSSLSAAVLSGSLSSALDGSGETPSPASLSSKIHPYPNANNSTSAQTRRRAVPVNTNQVSPSPHPQEKQDSLQFCSRDQIQQEGNPQRSGTSSDLGLGQRRRAGFDERVLPPRRQQLVRPLCQTEVERTRNSSEFNSNQDETDQTDSPKQTLDSYSNGSSRKLTRSSLREPLDISHLYNTSAVSQPRQQSQTVRREVSPALKQPASTQGQSSTSPNPFTLERRPQTQFTYRRNCSSPNRTGVESRSSTPPSPQSPLMTPQGSPRRQPSMFILSKNVSGVVRHVPSGCSPAVNTPAQGHGNSCLRAPVKTSISTSGIPKAPLNNQQGSTYSPHNPNPKDSSPSPKLKPKGVRPKIITYVRKNPQFKPQAADGHYQVSSLPSRLSAYAQGQTPNSIKGSSKEPSKPEAAPVLSASNLHFEKCRQDMQSNVFPSGVMSRSIRPPGHANTVPATHLHVMPHAHSHTAPPNLGSKADNFYGAQSEVGRSASFKGSSAEEVPQAVVPAGGTGSLLRSGRGLRLGLGAVNRTAAATAKGKGPGPDQRSAPVYNQPVQPVSPATSLKPQGNTDGQLFNQHAAAAPPVSAQPQAMAPASRSLLPKASQSGLRPPGFSTSRLPAGRLAAFGFIRTSSVSSVSSAQSVDSAQSDTCRTTQRQNVSEEPPPPHRVSTSPPSADHQRGPPCRSSSLQPPSTPALPRRFLPPQPRSSPGVGRKEFQRSSDVTRSLPSSPKRLAVVPPKPQSPVQSVQRLAAAVRGSAPPGSPRCVAPLRQQQEQQESLLREKEEAQQKIRQKQAEEKEKGEQREEFQWLQGHCEQQGRQLRVLREELKRTSLGLEAFIITTQHYCLKNKTTEENERKLSVEMQKLKEEMAYNSMRWERLHREKAALELAFKQELQELQLQQEAELVSVEEGLRKCHSAEKEHLRAEHRSEMEEIRTQQQEQMEEMTVNHHAAIQELRDMHNITMATLHEEHARTMRDLRKAHEQQKVLLEEDFGKLRLSLQDQVDTLTFQNQCLRDKAKRFEDALRRSTDEQIVEALAPYKHIEKDLKSLKEIVEMKNQQIHHQEQKISDLEKVAHKNVFLEEKVQVLQQQNEDLKTRIDKNLVLSRQLSEENANLQESVEKESSEKKRLSRNNEELLWRLQTSPLVSPASSPLHRSFSTSPAPSSPFFSSSPVAGCDSPPHCPGCSQHFQYCSPSHRAVSNQSFSPGPATPTHRAGTNQNYSPGPATPTHRASTSCNFNSLQR